MMESNLRPLTAHKTYLYAQPDDIARAGGVLVSSPDEVAELMRLLCLHHEFISLYVDHTDRFALTAALAVAVDQLILDMPIGPLREETLSAERLLCAARLKQVKLQFKVEAPQAATWQGRPALSVVLPVAVSQLQRRDFYRLMIPVQRPLYCYLTNAQGGEVPMPLFDIGIGGAGILGSVPGITLQAGDCYLAARIELPEIGNVLVDIEICTGFDLILKNGLRTRRTGLRFCHLPIATEALIQRYITRIERERMARESGQA